MLILNTPAGDPPVFIPHREVSVDAVEYQAAPDEYIRNLVHAGERFIVHENADDEHDRRCKILQESDQ